MHHLQIHLHREASSLLNASPFFVSSALITCIFKKNDVSVFHFSYCCFCVWSSTTSGSAANLTSCPSSSESRDCYRCQRKFRFWLSLRFAKVRAENDLSAISYQFLDCRKRCNKTVFICDLSVNQRYVKVASYQDFSFLLH